MNRRISDLLDGYEDGGVELSGDTPLSPGRIRELTMRRAVGGKKSRWHRAPLRVLAAAAAVAALTMTAFAAAKIFGAGDLMADMFTRWIPKPLTTTQVEALNEIGHVFDGSEQFSVTSNGATITPVAALADEDCYYLRLRVEAPEGVALPDLENNQHYWADVRINGERFSPATENSGLSYAAIFYQTLPDSDPTDNVKDIILKLEGGNARYNDGHSRLLTLRGFGIETMDGENWNFSSRQELFQGEFQLDIGTHFESRMAIIDCGGAVWTDPDTGETNVVETMKLSPLGIRFDFCTNLRRDNGRLHPDVPGDVRVVMKDGSEVSVGHSYVYIRTSSSQSTDDPCFQIGPDLLTDKPEWDFSSYRSFFTPIDLTQVDYVQFGEDYIYPIRAD